MYLLAFSASLSSSVLQKDRLYHGPKEPETFMSGVGCFYFMNNIVNNLFVAVITKLNDCIKGIN